MTNNGDIFLLAIEGSPVTVAGENVGALQPRDADKLQATWFWNDWNSSMMKKPSSSADNSMGKDGWQMRTVGNAVTPRFNPSFSPRN